MMQMHVSRRRRRRRSLAASLILSQDDEGAASFTDSHASLRRNAIQDIIRGVHRNWIEEGTKTWHHLLIVQGVFREDPRQKIPWGGGERTPGFVRLCPHGGP